MESPGMWSAGADYERYMGRWSRLVAARFVPWLEVGDGLDWLDVGCGVGALTSAILQRATPATVTGVDRSDGFLAEARRTVGDDRVRFGPGDAASLPFPAASFDVVVSGLVLNFLPEPDQAVAEMVRVVRPDGVVAAYVWDYAGKMDLFNLFWREAVRLDPDAARLDQARKFGLLAQPGALSSLWRGAGLTHVVAEGIEIELRFDTFDDFWRPFLGGQGGAPSYVATRSAEQAERLREGLMGAVPIAADGSITLEARAWAVRGRA